MIKQKLKIKEIYHVVVNTYWVIQSAVKIDELLNKLFLIIDPSVQGLEASDFKEKIDTLYQLLEKIIQRPGWKTPYIGKNSIQFQPKFLKSVLLDLAYYRNRFAHANVLYDEINAGISELGPGAIQFFLLNPISPDVCPLEAFFNEELILRKNLIAISMGTLLGIPDEKFFRKYSKADNEFVDYKDLFDYYKILFDYSFHSLNLLIDVLRKPSNHTPQ